MRKLGLNVWVLMAAGALGMSAAPLVVFIGGLVGARLAPDPGLATLPVASLVVGTATCVFPVTRLMRMWGRKAVFIVSAMLMSLVSVLAAWSIAEAQFWYFTFCMVLQGGGLAVIQQFRFAAMESVSPEESARAASFVLLGGLVAAFLGPEVAHAGRSLMAAEFAGSFLMLGVLALLSALVLMRYQPVVTQAPLHQGAQTGRPLRILLRQQVLWVALLSSGVAYAVMSFIMTATPASMHVVCGYSLADTKWVIQAHIMAMYLPSFFSGRLIQRFGIQNLMFAGLLVFMLCVGVAFSGQTLMHFWIALILLGIGWNFLFVAGTALLPQSYEGDERFKVQGLNDSVVFGLQAIAALSSGVVIFAGGWKLLVVLAVPIIVLQWFVLFSWRRIRSG